VKHHVDQRGGEIFDRREALVERLRLLDLVDQACGIGSPV
jgi:hypothetical protein